MMTNLLTVSDLQIRFSLREGAFTAVDGISIDIRKGKVLALVGESGCGKSVTAKALLGLLPRQAAITRGSINLHAADGKSVDIARLPVNGPAIRRIRGKRIAMIFQEPMASFSPVHTIGDQIGEVVALHEQATKRQVRERVIEILRLVNVPMPERRMKAYPHELSGGLRQRAMIAMALACNPDLVVADEPTTALDVTIQAQVLNLLRDLQKRLHMAILMITHDLGVVAQIADDVAVMYMGRIVEKNSVEQIFANPRHPYTKGLLQSVPRIGDGNVARLASIAGSVPGAFAKLQGCPFHPRCPERMAGLCDQGAAPGITAMEDGGEVRCHLYNPAAQAVVTSAGQQGG